MFMTAGSAEKFVTVNLPITQQTNIYYSLQGLPQKGTKTQLRQDYPLFINFTEATPLCDIISIYEVC